MKNFIKKIIYLTIGLISGIALVGPLLLVAAIITHYISDYSDWTLKVTNSLLSPEEPKLLLAGYGEAYEIWAGRLAKELAVLGSFIFAFSAVAVTTTQWVKFANRYILLPISYKSKIILNYQTWTIPHKDRKF